ncbi:MAG: glycosyltransferase family 4 protein [Candidatus Methanoperedens sp.]
MNIVHISGGELRIPVEKGGGHEAYVLNICRCLARAGHNAVILDRKYSADDKDIEEIDGVKIVRLKARKFTTPNYNLTITLNQLSFARKVNKYLRKTEFEVIHIHVSITCLFLAMMSPDFRKKLFYTSHATRRSKSSASLLDKMAIGLENRAVKYVHKAVVLNELVRKEFIEAGMKFENTEVLPMGTDTVIFNPDIDVEDIKNRYTLQSEVTVLFVGRVRADKGVEYLVKAADILINKSGYRNVEFILVGPTEEFGQTENLKSSYLEKVTRLIEDNSLQNKVRLTGAVTLDDLIKLYAACDIFVLPSLTEAAPQAIAEAMSSGKPVIGSRVGSIPTQIVDGHSGFLIDPADEKQLADKLKYLIDNPVERKRMGDCGRGIATEQFDWQQVTEALIKIYRTQPGVVVAQT